MTSFKIIKSWRLLVRICVVLYRLWYNFYYFHYVYETYLII